MGKKPVGGVEEVAKMLQHMDDASREKLLSNLAARDPSLVKQIQEKLFTIEDLLKVEPRVVQKLLREVPSKQLALALRGTSAELRHFVFGNMSGKAAKMLE